MPLIYLPLIMYAGRMEFMLQPPRQCADHPGADHPANAVEAAQVADPRACS